MEKNDTEARIRELMRKTVPSEERLEDTLAGTTRATVWTGAGTIGLDLMNMFTEGEALGYLAQTTGRVFGGLLWLDVGIGMYLLYKRVKRNQMDRDERIIVEVPAS